MTSVVTSSVAPAPTPPPNPNPWAVLRERLVAAGCFDVDGTASVASLFVHIAVAAGSWWCAAQLGVYGIVPAIFGSFMFYRIGFLMHDAAHGSACADRTRNERFAIACCMVLGEFLSGWRYGHNRHHAAPNVRGKDGDQSERWDPRYRYNNVVIAAFDLFFFHRFGRFIRVPKTLFLMGIRDGVYCFKTNRPAFARECAWVVSSQLVQLAFFVWLLGPLGVLAFAFHSHIGVVYLNAVFAGNHYDLESFDVDTAADVPGWALQVRASRNYTDDVATVFVSGGLAFQIEHHLFPTLPRRRLRRAAPIVRAWCAEQGLRYEQLSLPASLARVVRFHMTAAT